jgi:hypothetical protein
LLSQKKEQAMQNAVNTCQKSGRPSQQAPNIFDTALNNSRRVSAPALTYLDGSLEASEHGGPRTHLPFLLDLHLIDGW